MLSGIDLIYRGSPPTYFQREVNHKVNCLLIGLGIALLTSGCAGLAALPLSAASSLLSPAGAVEIHNQTAVRLDQPNFVVVRTNATGHAKGFALLGLITLVPAKFSTAMDRFYASAAIQTGKPQAIADVVLEKSSTFWILFSIPEISVRGDIVEFVPSSDEDTPPTPMEVTPNGTTPVPEAISKQTRHNLRL